MRTEPGEHVKLVTGRVTDDAAEPDGIPGVAVTDGLAVTRTNVDGHYRLHVDPRRRRTQLVYLTVPAGWRAPLQSFSTPSFFRRVDLSSRNPVRGVDFVLHPDPASEREAYRFVSLADVHVQAGGVNPREGFARQLSEIGAIAQKLDGPSGPPSFITVAGDLTNNASSAEFRDYHGATASASVPVWSAPGNHDLVGREPGGPYPNRFPEIPYRDLVDAYRQSVGPEWFSFQYGGQHFVVLENYRGLAEHDQLTWLKRDLALHAADKRTVVIAHVPWDVPQTPDPAVTAPYFDLFREHDVQLLLAGHTHSNDISNGVIDGIRQVVTTSPASPLDGTPRGFRMVEIGTETVRTPFYELDADRRLTIVHPVGDVPQSLPTVRVARYRPPDIPTQAEFRIGDGPWRSLERVGRRTWTATPELEADRTSHTLGVRVRDDQKKSWEETRAAFTTSEGTLTAPRQGSPWPMFRRDATRAGASPDPVHPPLNLAWASYTGGTVLSSSPTVVADTVYVGVRDEDDHVNYGVVAFDLATGALRWSAPAGGPVEASVAVGDGIAVAPAARGPLQGLDASTGDVCWEWAPDDSRCWMYFSPAIVGSTVYQAYSLPDGVRVAMLDLRTGEATGETTESVGRNWISRGSPAVADDRLYFTTAYGNLVAADATSGKLAWQTPLGSPLAVRTAPVIVDDLVVQACEGDRLVAVDTASGAERWTYQAKRSSMLAGAGTASGPAVADGCAYVGFTDGSVVAVQLDDGEQRWRHETGGPVLSSPAVSGDVLYVGSHDGKLRALARDTGACLWWHDLGCWVASSPAVSGNSVVVGAWDGHVYLFTAAADVKQ